MSDLEHDWHEFVCPEPSECQPQGTNWDDDEEYSPAMAGSEAAAQVRATRHNVEHHDGEDVAFVREVDDA